MTLTKHALTALTLLVVCVSLASTGCMTPNSRIKEPPKNTPGADDAPDTGGDSGNIKISRKFCKDDANQPEEGEVSGYVGVIFPYTFKYKATLRCAGGKAGQDDSCWECDDKKATIEIVVKGRMSISVIIGTITTDETETVFTIKDVDKKNCSGPPQKFEESANMEGTWHAFGTSGPFTGKVTLKGTVQGCCESGRVCYTVKVNQFEWEATRGAADEGGGGGGAAGAAAGAGGDEVEWVGVIVDLTAPEILWSPIDPATGEPYQIVDPETGELVPYGVRIEDPFELYDIGGGLNGLKVRLADRRRFIRGEVNGDWTVDIADAIEILHFLFVEGYNEVPHLDALDVNDDGGIDVSDAVYLLMYLFGGGRQPPEPFARRSGQALQQAAGEDPTPDDIPEVYMRVGLPKRVLHLIPAE